MDAFSFKMSRNSDNITLTDSHAMLADESLNENHPRSSSNLRAKLTHCVNFSRTSKLLRAVKEDPKGIKVQKSMYLEGVA